MKSRVWGSWRGALRYLVAGIGVVLISACSYQPVSHQAHIALPDPIYVDVVLSRVEPQAGVYLKDEMMKLLRTHFQERVVLDKTQAHTQLIVPHYKVSYSPVTYDSDGYVTRYSASISMTIQIKTPKDQRVTNISASEDTNIQPGSLTSTKAREEAIRTAIRKAMDKFVAYLARRGYGK